ncbi:MAG: hypothetical protein WC473_05640 [Patescibacteria group bacterium]|jgi:hypothetical protein
MINKIWKKIYNIFTNVPVYLKLAIIPILFYLILFVSFVLLSLIGFIAQRFEIFGAFLSIIALPIIIIMFVFEFFTLLTVSILSLFIPNNIIKEMTTPAIFGGDISNNFGVFASLVFWVIIGFFVGLIIFFKKRYFNNNKIN